MVVCLLTFLFLRTLFHMYVSTHICMHVCIYVCIIFFVVSFSPEKLLSMSARKYVFWISFVCCFWDKLSQLLPCNLFPLGLMIILHTSTNIRGLPHWVIKPLNMSSWMSQWSSFWHLHTCGREQVPVVFGVIITRPLKNI